jgi:hypothetical protein
MSILSAASSIASGLLNRQAPAFSQLAKSIESKAVSGARKAFSDVLQQAAAAVPPAAQQDLSALGNALSAGNLSQAQNAFSKLIQDAGSAAAHQRTNYQLGPAARSSGLSVLG